MEACETSQRSSPQKPHAYFFCIKFLRITGIRLPIPPISGASSSKNSQRYFLKITILHGIEQQNIGEFEVIGDECVINQQLSCEIKYGRPDKLHVYIDQNWSAGLSGHITLDLKEFFEDDDVEIYLEYPLFSSGSSHVRRTSKLEMSVLCTCSTKTNDFPDLIDPNQEYMYFEDLSEPRPSLDDHWYPPVRLDTESSHDAPPLLLEGDSKQVSATNLSLVKVDREIEMLKEMEGDLIELNSKLNKYVAGHSLEKYAPGQYRNEVPTRPEVMAAMFFAAGMAFERQVDSACRLRMYRATDDPLLPGETPLLSGGNTPFLLEDVSPTFRRDSSANPEVKEADTFCPARKKSFRLCENSSNSCGEQKPCSCTSEVASSLAGEIDEDDNDQSYFNSPIDAKDMPMRLPDPELVGFAD
nr:uncharacterized protein LOC112286811 isoform X2 [Physcomitrium patens]XP_024384878.1 uncharacterized protein LOC112286811 isoform X2 [Physcomitrium patens]XP_024384879.1 uncharacterized protein LOC112286811 isoform X2 [Physcomitrium patens]|eukprot:XP_024384877.1 uncharacterized protein LOC112286811 isoform X2 [Physcomitrella patens]